jgi:hypothetical protein
MYVNPEIEQELQENQRLRLALQAEIDELEKRDRYLRSQQVRGWIKATEGQG